ncbi:hypothetical protein OH77DRAFT_261713 [Trametes cingulata]|nr:hypothetical protein OH77DRAFT_261713 [Trametes cingulata]
MPNDPPVQPFVPPPALDPDDEDYIPDRPPRTYVREPGELPFPTRWICAATRIPEVQNFFADYLIQVAADHLLRGDSVRGLEDVQHEPLRLERNPFPIPRNIADVFAETLETFAAKIERGELPYLLLTKEQSLALPEEERVARILAPDPPDYTLAAYPNSFQHRWFNTAHSEDILFRARQMRHLANPRSHPRPSPPNTEPRRDLTLWSELASAVYSLSNNPRENAATRDEEA